MPASFARSARDFITSASSVRPAARRRAASASRRSAVAAHSLACSVASADEPLGLDGPRRGFVGPAEEVVGPLIAEVGELGPFDRGSLVADRLHLQVGGLVLELGGALAPALGVRLGTRRANLDLAEIGRRRVGVRLLVVLPTLLHLVGPVGEQFRLGLLLAGDLQERLGRVVLAIAVDVGDVGTSAR